MAASFKIDELRRRDGLPSCDWGGCNKPSEWERFFGEMGWLPVCDDHLGPVGPFAGLEVARLLEISTGHMTERDNDLLYESAAGVIYYPLEEVGWLVWCGNENHHPVNDMNGGDRIGSDSMSDAFKKILEFAHEVGITWVKFDKDSPHYSQFEVFEW